MNESERERQTRLDLSECGLRTVPKEVLRLRALEFAQSREKQVKRAAGFVREGFTEPEDLILPRERVQESSNVLGEMEHLFMLSFKANKVREIPEQSLPIASLGWLILSDNEIEVLPKSLGKVSKMRKLMLAGNKIKELPTL